MSSSPGLVQSRDVGIKPIAEFRRWIVVDSFFAIAGALATWGASRLSDPFAALPWLVIGLCTCFALGEACIQFKSWWRRIVWTLSGTMIGAILLSPFSSGGFPVLPYLLPASLECLSSIRARRFPWVWLVATPAFLELSDLWVPSLDHLINHVLNLMETYIGTRLIRDSELASYAAFLAPPLVFRATIGSFIASRKAI